MSSWVVPSVAADMWNVSVQVILDLVKAGALISREVESFLFVDIASAGDCALLPASLRPATYSIVTSAELAALHAEPIVQAEPPGEGDPDEELGQPLDDDPSESSIQPDISQWRTIRKNVSRTRRPPPTFAAAA